MIVVREEGGGGGEITSWQWSERILKPCACALAVLIWAVCQRLALTGFGHA